MVLEGWWKWRLPGQAGALHLALDDSGEVCHRVLESQWFSALQALEPCRPRTYRGLSSAVQREAVRSALVVAGNKLELVLMRSQLAGRNGLWREPASTGSARTRVVLTVGPPPQRTNTCCGPTHPWGWHERHGAR